MRGKTLGILFIAVALVMIFSLVAAGLVAANGNNTIEVSQPVQVTSNGYYERGQSIVYDGTNYWLFYGRSASCADPYQTGDPDGNDYVLFYKKASTVADLALAPASPVIGDTIQPTGVFNGETGAAYFDGKVWAFAPIDDPDYPGREALYGWYTTDGINWTAVGPFWGNKLRGSLHHDEVSFNGDLWIVEGAADGDVTTRHGDPYDPTTQAWIDSQLAINLGPSGGIMHFFVDGGELYLAGLKCTAPKANVIYHYNTGAQVWDAIANVSSEGWDPTLFKVGSTYVFTQAPWEDSNGGRQYNVTWSSNILDGNFFNRAGDPVATTGGKYGTNTWTDMWPIGFTDAGGNSYLFFTSERNPGNLGSEIAGNIWYLPVTWDVTRNHYTYVQEAINAANGGDTINVAAGTYGENIVIDEAVTLLGAQHDVDPVGSTDRGGESVIQGGQVEITAAATFNGFKLDGNRVWIHGADGATVSYNIIVDSTQHGVYIDGSSPNTQVLHNTVSSPAWQGISNQGNDGVIISHNYISGVDTQQPIESTNHAGTGIQITYNVISGCTNNKGIDYWGGPGPVISYNQITGTSDYWEAIYSDTKTNAIIGNIISDTGGPGIQLYPCEVASDADKSIINNNQITNTKYQGICVLGQAYTEITGNTLTHCNYYGADGTGDWDYAGIHVEDCGGSGAYCLIDDNTVTDGINGIQVWSSHCTITNNTVTDMGVTYADSKTEDADTYYNSGIIIGGIPSIGVSPTGTTVQGNTLMGNVVGLYVHSTATPIVASVNNNNFNSNGTQVVDAGSTLDIAAIFAGNTFDRAVAVDHPGNSLLPTIWSNIQDGIDAAVAGDTINVAAGTYEESVTINKNNLTVSGDISQSAITGGLKLDTDLTGLTLENFYVTGTVDPAQNSLVRMYGAVTDLTIDNCVFDGENVADRMGFSGGQIEGNLTVTNSEFMRIKGWSVLDTRSGSGGDGSAMADVTFANNNVHDCEGSIVFRGLSTDWTDNVYVYGNTFENIGQAGVSDHWAAFEVNRADNVEIYDNQISNVVENSWGEGQAMQLWKVGVADIHDNTIENNYQGIAILKWPTGETYDISNISIYDNSFSSNDQYALSVEDGLTGGPVDATENWWGSINGPEHAGNTFNIGSQGDAVSDYVNYVPWLDAPGGASFAPVTNANSSNQYSSIQAAIDDATAEDTIDVAAGTYNERVNINKSLTLEGANAGIPATEERGPESIINPQGLGLDFGVLIDGAGTTATIDGFMVENYTRGGILAGAFSLENDPDVVHILNNIVTEPIGQQNNNCIQVGDGTTGTVVGNEVSGANLESPDWSGSGILVAGSSGVVVSYNYVHDCEGGIQIAGYAEYRNAPAEDNIVEHNILEDNETGISVQGNSINTIIRYNDVSNSTDIGIDSVAYDVSWPEHSTPSGTEIHNNNIVGNVNYGVKSSVWGTHTGTVPAEEVNAINNWWGSASGPEHADNTFNIGSQGDAVDDNSDYVPWLDAPGGASFAPVTNANSSNQYSSIQAAIDAAVDGDTINVAAGQYTEAITVTKPLTLLGATWDVNKNGYAVPADYAWDTTVESVIVHPDPAGEYISIVDIYDIDGVTFQGFIVQELNAEANKNSSLVRVRAQTKNINVNIINNVIGPNTNTTSQDGTHGRMGLYLVNNPYSDQYGIVDSTIAGNKIFGCEGNGNNVFIWSSYFGYNAAGPASMSGTVIEDNEISGSHRSGIETAGGFSDLIIRNNSIHGNFKLEGNTPDLKYGNGILMIRGSGDRDNVEGYGPVNVTLENNDIYNNDGYGIYMGPNNEGITLTHNNVYNNGQGGIVVDLIGNYWNPDFETYSGPYTNLNGSSDITAHFNRIYDNGQYGISVNGEPTNGFVLDATRNWWGSAHAATIATKVNGAVDYDPWHLKAPVPLAVGEVTANSIVLNWTIDSVWSGDYYDFRYSTTPILTNADWNNARRITGEPAPVNGAQTMKIRKLDSDTTYYFGFTLADGNYRSDINLTDAKTLAVAPVDDTAPAPITNLGAVLGTPSTTSVVLTWTATGDDGATGFATKYIVKRSTNPIDATNFDRATTIYNSLTPKASGEGETLTITRLNPGVTYYFAIKVQDEVPNTSTISNVVSMQTANVLPTVTNIDPATGDNGQLRTLTIDGNNFAGAGTTIVRLVNNQNTLTLTNVTIVNNTRLTADVPKGVPTGTYRARIINNNGKSEPSAATYIITAAPVPLPVVTNVIPNIAASDTAADGVEIFGANFAGATAVTINGHDAPIVSVTATKITVNVPGMSAGEYDVKVTVPAAGTNDVSAVKYVVTEPVVITDDSTDTTTSSVVELTDNNIPVQLTLTTDDSESAPQNTDVDAEISVTIEPDTTVTDSNGDPYTGTLNPPRVVKPDTTIQSNLSEDAIVIEMGNPDQTIIFDQDFVAVVRVIADSPPKIYYYNKTSGQYELAGKAGTQDGIIYAPGGTVLAVESISATENIYTIGLLLDHMSVYVASTESLLPSSPAPSPPPPGGGGGGGGGATIIPPGTTDIGELTTTAGRFLEDVYAYSEDQQCSVFIPQDTIGLTEDLEPLDQISIVPIRRTLQPPAGSGIIGLPYDFGPSGATFDPPITITFTFDPTEIPFGADISDLKLATYTYNPITGEVEWTVLSNIQINTETNTISGETSHFTVFAVTIAIPLPAEFVLSPLSISPMEASSGETVNISFDVTNTGDLAGAYDFTLVINNRVIETRQIELSGHASQTVTFTVSRTSNGIYKISIGPLSGQFIVKEVSTPSTATPAPTTTTPAPTTTTPAPTATTSAPTATTPAAGAPEEAPITATNWGMIIGIIAAAAVIIGVPTIVLYLKRRRD